MYMYMNFFFLNCLLINTFIAGSIYRRFRLPKHKILWYVFYEDTRK